MWVKSNGCTQTYLEIKPLGNPSYSCHTSHVTHHMSRHMTRHTSHVRARLQPQQPVAHCIQQVATKCHKPANDGKRWLSSRDCDSVIYIERRGGEGSNQSSMQHATATQPCMHANTNYIPVSACMSTELFEPGKSYPPITFR
jgi:hypothetical protein